MDVQIVSSKVCFEKSSGFESVACSCLLQFLQNCSACLLDKTGRCHPVQSPLKHRPKSAVLLGLLEMTHTPDLYFPLPKLSYFGIKITLRGTMLLSDMSQGNQLLRHMVIVLSHLCYGCAINVQQNCSAMRSPH